MKIELKKPYNVFDNNGDCYTVNVSTREAMILDLDQNKVYRLLQKLKAKGVKPQAKWHDSAESSSLDVNVSEWQPPAKSRGRGGGKAKPSSCVQQAPSTSSNGSGAKWEKEPTKKFLAVCYNYADKLKVKQVPLSVWEKIRTDSGLAFSAKQLREKMRNMKRFYNETKEGKHGQESWAYYHDMRRIFDGGVQSPVQSTCAPGELITQSIGAALEPEEQHDYVEEIPSISGMQNLSSLGVSFLDGEDFDNIPVSSADNAELIRETVQLGSGKSNTVQTSTVEREIPSISGMQNLSSLGVSFLDGEDFDNIPVSSADNAELIGATVQLGSGKSNTVQTSTVVRENKQEATITVEVPSVSGLEVSLSSVNLSDDEEEVVAQSDGLGEVVQADANNNIGSPKLPATFGLDSISTLKHPRNDENDWNEDVFELSPEDSNTVQPSLFSHEKEETALSRSDVLKSGPSMKRASLVRPIQLPTPKNNTNATAVIQLQNDTLMNSYSHFERPIMPSSTPTSGNCTPPKKKSTSGRLVYSPRKLNLPKTPTRKVASIHLVWDTKATETLVQICTIKRRDVSANPNSVKMWKDIAEEMKVLGHEKAWDVVRAKYGSLSTFFTSVIKNEGLVNGIKWPYYDAFCLIHSDHEESATAARIHWTHEMELLLITLYSERKDKFEANEGTPTRHSLLYREISAKMKMFGHDVSGSQCERHMDSLISDFRKAFDMARNTGSGAPQMRHYDIFLQMFEGAPSLVAPVALSVGRGKQYSINGETKEDEQRNTRTRTTAANNKKAASFKSGNTQKKSSTDAEPANNSWMSRWQDMLERQDKRSEEKMRLFRMYIESMVKPKE